MGPPAYDHDDDDDQLQEEQDAAAAGPSVEQVFEGEPVPELFTARSVAVGAVLGTTLSVVAMKLTLTSGYNPFLTIPAGLLSFFLSRAWITVFSWRVKGSCGTSQPSSRRVHARERKKLSSWSSCS